MELARFVQSYARVYNITPQKLMLFSHLGLFIHLIFLLLPVEMAEYKIADAWKQLHDSSGGTADKRLVSGYGVVHQN